MKMIPLTKGMVALCDDSDFAYLSQFKWQVAEVRKKAFYAARHFKQGNKQVRLYMHRELLNVPDGLVVDHKDGCTLNNQRSNLRIATVAQNRVNSKSNANNTSGFRCVTWDSRKRRWVVRLGFRYNGKRTSRRFGTYKSKEEAVKVRDAVYSSKYGEFAKL